MVRKRWTRFLLLGCLLAVPSEGFSEPAGQIVWMTKPGQAFDAATESSRPVVVDFWAIWCAPCKAMEETTYRDPAVIRALEKTVPLKIDIDANAVLVERYDIDAFPTVLVLDGKGREITRMRGLIEAPQFLGAIDAVTNGYRPYLEALGRRDDPDALESVASYLLSVENPAGAVDHLKRCLKLLGESEPTRRQAVELTLAEARLSLGEAKAAARSLAELLESATDLEIRGRALVALIRAERERGRDADAEVALERLRREHPEIAAAFESGQP